ncbi:penicillin-binding protein [Bacillus aquiflavi]|nr:penicillin-binding protein [Bacillus aquiflavi]
MLAAKAEQKYKKERIIDASRGSIFDRKGEVIAEDIVGYKLVAILDESLTTNPKKPKHVVYPKTTAKALAKHIDMDEPDIYEILTKEKRYQVEFGRAGRDISNKTKQEIEKLKLPGITFVRDTKRFYPNGIFASHLIGYIEKKEDKNGKIKTAGKLGLENSLEGYLKETDGKISFESDLWGYLLPNGKEKITPPKHGSNVYLTIDKIIQTFLEDSMNKVAEEYKPKKIIGIVADAKTGEILAMGQRPTFHPNSREGIEDSWHNEAVENSYEPGSTMKVFTLAAAIEEGVFNPNETFKSGAYVVGRDRIHDHNRYGWGQISYLEGVQRSSNVAFAKIALEKLGEEAFYDYLLEFGFDRPTGIELPNEVGGKILFNVPIEVVTTSYGQGTAVTPIQQIQAMTAIANDGKMRKPQVLKKIVDPNSGKVMKEVKSEVVSTPISAETAKKVRDILETVVTSPKGTGTLYQIDGYQVAGKTGTAQIPGPDGRYLYGHNQYVYSFLGVAPKDDPKLIMYVAVQEPSHENGVNGAVPVAEVFNSVMKHSLQYLNIEPSEVKKATARSIPNLVDQPVEEAKSLLEESGYEAVVIGEGLTVAEQNPPSKTTLLEGQKVIIKTDGNMIMPDMIGWSLRDVMKVVKLAELKLKITGNGYVIKQNLSPGSFMNKGDEINVKLEEPSKTYGGETEGNDEKAKSKGNDKKAKSEGNDETPESEGNDKKTESENMTQEDS